MSTSEVDDVIFEACDRLLQAMDHKGVVTRAIVVFEYHDENGEPFVRASATRSTEWWHSAGLLTAAHTVLVPVGDHTNIEWLDGE